MEFERETGELSIVMICCFSLFYLINYLYIFWFWTVGRTKQDGTSALRNDEILSLLSDIL